MSGKRSHKDKKVDPQRTTRRISIFLILGVVAVIAIGLWLFSTWFANRYYSGTNRLSDLPPPTLQSDTPSSDAPQGATQ